MLSPCMHLNLPIPTFNIDTPKYMKYVGFSRVTATNESMHGESGIQLF